VLNKHLPLAVIGSKSNAEQLKKIPCRLPLWQHGLDVMESLAAVSMAKVFLGGETGYTLWASVLGVPTIGAYHYWGMAGTHDARPIPFSAPVVNVRIQGDVIPALDYALRLFNKLPVQST
jgi:ADP-heptose:LPS heptosyltransferase